ncbi:hypothetical protein, partial [Staphylococcus haemolyticus]|uniref:hypothetical protein n=1 Tax=Staphylococcus haemolyticus TaxID=1283 RepID=UPI001C5CA8F8
NYIITNAAPELTQNISGGAHGFLVIAWIIRPAKASSLPFKNLPIIHRILSLGLSKVCLFYIHLQKYLKIC